MVKEITQQRLRNITLYYLARFDASADKVRAMLKRRIAKTISAGLPVPPETPQWIENIITDMRHLGYLNDTRYAENQIRLLTNQGKSTRFIILKLKEDGIDEYTIRSLLTAADTSDGDQARRFVKRKKIGPYRPPEQRLMYRQKDLAALARAGFSYETAREALMLPSDD